MSKSAYIVADRRYAINQKLQDSVAMIQRLVAFCDVIDKSVCTTFRLLKIAYLSI